MTISKACLVAMMLLLSATLGAQEYGDAPAGYGDLHALQSGGPVYGGLCSLGTGCTTDTTGPVTPAWTGDADDGIVGTPHFDSWSSYNTLTVELCYSSAHLVLFVDADDNGAFSQAETYKFNADGMMMPGVHTFTGIKIHATQAFSRNGTNKVAVRITAQESVGGWPNTSPNGYFYEGEVEDWLIDVDPPHLAVAAETLREAAQGVPFTFNLTAVNGTPGYAWSLVSGTLPSGMTITQVGDAFRLSGTPALTGVTGLQQYPITVQVDDAAAQTATRNLVLVVSPPPVSAPFKDDFAVDQGWRLQGSWTRAAAAAFTGWGWSFWCTQPTDPGQDASPTADNMLLSDTFGAEIGDVLPQTMTATSPKVDCRQQPSVELRFMRWLSFYSYDFVKIEVTGDGASWHPVWIPPDMGYSPITLQGDIDSGWYGRVFDISQHAAGSGVVQVRFTLGPVNTAYKIGWGCTGATGWNIDDVYIGAPATVLGGASGFYLNSPGSIPIGGVNYTIGYPGYQHTWSVNINNGLTSDLSVEEVRVEAHISSATAYGFGGTIYVGEWLVALPQTISAGASAYSLQGTFDCASIFAALALVPMDCTISIRGTVQLTGEPFLITDSCLYTHFYGPMPGLHVWEAPAGSSGTSEISNGETAAGLRDFGSVVVGGSSSNVWIICKSTTSNAITVAPPTMLGPNWMDFTVYAQSPWDSQPQQGQNNCWFTIRFTPQSPGPKTCWLEFAHDAGNTGTPFSFECKGVGVVNAPVLAVNEGSAAGPQISNGSAAVGPLDFGQQMMGAGPGAALVIYIENAGTQDLTLGSPVVNGNTDFYVDIAGMLGTVTPGSSTSFSVYFDPAQLGAQSATIEFAHNDTGTATPFSFSVAAEGILSAPRLEVYDSQSLMALAPGTSRSFGQQTVSAGPGPSLLIEIRNTGWQQLDVSTPTLSGTHTGDFTLDLTQFSPQVAPGASTHFELVFDPTAKGFKDAVVSFTHNDPAVTNPFTIALSGYGDDPLGVFITSSAMPSAQATIAYAQFLTAASGTQPYTWTMLSGTLAAGLTVNADGSVTGTPTQDGLYSFRVRVTDSNGGTDERQISLIVSPAPGTLAGGSGGGGGCSASTSGPAFVLLVLMLALIAAQRRKARQ